MKGLKGLTKIQRDSNIELLRIIAACFVVVLHYNFPRVYDAIQTIPEGIERTYRLLLVGLLESISVCAVNVFILITGYFLCKSMKRTWDKPIKLILFLVIVRSLVFVIYSIREAEPFSVVEWLLYSLPRNYFVPLYVALYIISPYINIVINRLSVQERNRLVLILLCVFSFWTICVDLITDISDTDVNSMSTFGRLGGAYGQTFVNFCTLYCIGAILRLNSISLHKKHSLALLSCTTLLLLVWFLIEGKTKSIITDFIFCYYHNPLVISQAVFIFLFFKEIRFKSPLINELAATAFGCYILQGYILRFCGIEKAALLSIPFFLIHMFGCVIAIYLFSYIVFKLYSIATDKLIFQLKKKEILFLDETLINSDR